MFNNADSYTVEQIQQQTQLKPVMQAVVLWSSFLYDLFLRDYQLSIKRLARYIFAMTRGLHGFLVQLGAKIEKFNSTYRINSAHVSQQNLIY